MWGGCAVVVVDDHLEDYSSCCVAFYVSHEYLLQLSSHSRQHECKLDTVLYTGVLQFFIVRLPLLLDCVIYVGKPLRKYFCLLSQLIWTVHTPRREK